MNLFSPVAPPAALLEGGPLVVASPRRTVEILDRTGMTRVAKAALLLVERSGKRRAEAALENGFAARTLQALILMEQPWRVSAEVIARLEAALELEQGDVLAGRAPEPQGQVGRQIRRCG